MSKSIPSFNSSLIAIGVLAFIVATKWASFMVHLLEFLLSFEGVPAIAIYFTCELGGVLFGLWVFFKVYRNAKQKNEKDTPYFRTTFINLIIWFAVVILASFLLPLTMGALMLETPLFSGYLDYQNNLGSTDDYVVPMIYAFMEAGMYIVIFTALWKGMKTPQKSYLTTEVEE